MNKFSFRTGWSAVRRNLATLTVSAVALVGTGAANAGDRDIERVAGTIFGAVVGAAVGEHIGGRDGAKVGGLLGATAGLAITSSRRGHVDHYPVERVRVHHPRYRHGHRHAHGPRYRHGHSQGVHWRRHGNNHFHGERRARVRARANRAYNRGYREGVRADRQRRRQHSDHTRVIRQPNSHRNRGSVRQRRDNQQHHRPSRSRQNMYSVLNPAR